MYKQTQGCCDLCINGLWYHFAPLNVWIHTQLSSILLQRLTNNSKIQGRSTDACSLLASQKHKRTHTHMHAYTKGRWITEWMGSDATHSGSRSHGGRQVIREITLQLHYLSVRRYPSLTGAFSTFSLSAASHVLRFYSPTIRLQLCHQQSINANNAAEAVFKIHGSRANKQFKQAEATQRGNTSAGEHPDLSVKMDSLHGGAPRWHFWLGWDLYLCTGTGEY